MNLRTMITKAILLSLILLLLPAAVSAQTPSMIPDDFDWSMYIQDWENAWNEGWGNNNGNSSYYNGWTGQNSYVPYSYEWYGETYTVDPWNGADPGSSDYVPVPVYPQDDDRWFYETQEINPAENSAVPGSGNGTLPSIALLSDFVGYAQTYTLDCETRSAVDLAAYMGVSINHGEFLNRLPRSDDPNEGFVGNVNDPRGQIPPASYGVYQEPVAALLRQYGLSAVGVSGYTDEALKAQIASGRPVMVWVVGNTEVGYGTAYTPSNGRTTMVAPYQHTVIVIGYDEYNVTIQDGANRYTRTWETFDISWGALGNRAIYINR